MNFQYISVVLLLVFGFAVTEDVKNVISTTGKPMTVTTESTPTTLSPTTANTSTTTTPVTPTTPKTTTTTTPVTSTTPKTTTTPVTPTTPPPSNNSDVLPVQDNPKHAETGKWVAMDKKNVSQIILETRATFHFQYNDSTNKKPIDVDIYLPRNASVSLVDQDDVDLKVMSLKWSLEHNRTNEVKFVFLKNESNYELHKIMATIHPTPKYFRNYTGSNVIEIASNGSVYEMIPVNASYVCVSDIVPDLIHSSAETVSYDVKLSLTHFEAFMAKNSTLFNLAKECDMDGSQVVVIVVIVILIILIATVLAFYLINRRRSQAQGYTSM